MSDLKKTLVIFLDFDGVLHFFFPKAGYSDDANQFFALVPNFQKVIRQFRDCLDFKIVISSSWRESKTFDELYSVFDSDIRSLIVGINPILSDGDYSGSRERESVAWMKEHHYEGNWIAIDDNTDIWSSHDRLVFCEDGLFEKEMAVFENFCLTLINS